MKATTFQTIVIALLVAVCTGQLVTGECPKVPVCCEEDCCGPGTSWSVSQCVAEATSPGFTGSYSDGYVVGCVPRVCCEADCCTGVLVYDEETGYCLEGPTPVELAPAGPTPQEPTPEGSIAPTPSSAPSEGDKVEVCIVSGFKFSQYEHVKPSATKQFSLEFDPASKKDDVKSYKWTANFHKPNVNGPKFEYTTPDKAETGLKDFHWYGHGDVADDGFSAPSGGESDKSLRWIGNVANPCSYEVLCEITFKDGSKVTARIKDGKYFFVKVDDGGRTRVPSLNVDDDDAFKLEMNRDGEWIITDRGTLKRQPGRITDNAARSSQFFDKTNTHESLHLKEWETVDPDTKKPLFFEADKFYPMVKDFKAPTKIELKNKIIQFFNNVYKPAQNKAHEDMFGDIQDTEKRAYKAEYDVEPKGVRERSDRWIETRYPKNRRRILEDKPLFT